MILVGLITFLSSCSGSKVDRGVNNQVLVEQLLVQQLVREGVLVQLLPLLYYRFYFVLGQKIFLTILETLLSGLEVDRPIDLNKLK